MLLPDGRNRRQITPGIQPFYPKAAPSLLFLSVLLIYLVLPTSDYYWDGNSFAQNIEDSRKLSPDLLHPHYLIYTPVGSLIQTGLARFSCPVRCPLGADQTGLVLSCLSQRTIYSALFDRPLSSSIERGLLFHYGPGQNDQWLRGLVAVL